MTEKVKNKDGDEPEAVPQKDKKGKEKEEEEGSDGVSVHVEAVVESLELLLYSGVGEVAEVKVEGKAPIIILWYCCEFVLLSRDDCFSRCPS